MEKLLLIHGFKTGCTALDLRDILLKLFEHKNVEKLWLDPYRENRAVAMFKENLDLSELSRLTADELLGEIIQPTNKIFIRAYGTFKVGAKDKLEMMFKKYIYQYSVSNDDCFEVFFKGGWETVLAVCGREWKNGGQKLTVLPYFDCFQEPFDEQTERLSHNMKFNCKVVESDAASALQSYNGQIPHELNESSAVIQDHPTQNTESTDISLDIQQLTLQDETVETFEKSTLIHYEQSIIPLILKGLNFEKALKETKFPSKVEITPTDVTIAGSASLVKKMRQILLEKNFKFSKSPRSLEFLALEKIQQEIKIFIENYDIHLFIDENNADLRVIVVDDQRNKRDFHEFISQLVVEKNCLHLSSKELEEKKELLDYIENINRTNKYCQIFIEDGNVLLLSLSYQSDLMDSVASEIQKFVNTNVGEIQNHSIKKVRVNIGFREKYFIWLLDVLKFQTALEKTFPDLYVKLNIDKQDISFRGYENQIALMKRTLTEQNDQITLDFYEDTLLTNKNVQSQLKKTVTKFGYIIVIIGKDNPKIVVHDKNSQVVFLKNFVGKLIMKKTSYSFKNNTHLEQLAADINSKFQSLHVFAEEKKLTLFAFQGYDKGDVDKVTEFILSQNLGEFNATQHQSAHINDEVENESEQSKISIFQCEPQRLAYCEKFLKTDIVGLQPLDESKRTLLIFGQNGIEIHYTSSQMLKAIEEHLTEMFKKIIFKNSRLVFPGMKYFMDSESGQELIEFISQKYECLIEFPEFKDQPSQFEEYVTPRANYSRRDYNSVLLKSAKLRGLDFHFIQGDINNMNLDMRVEFVPSSEAECSISTQASSKLYAHYIINLPKWRVPKGEAVQDFYKTLREGLKENVNIMFQQVIKISCYKIGISTSQLHDSKYPFPLDVIAEAVVCESLILKESVAQGSKTFDVFICETKRESVFKAFLYYLNGRNFHLSQLDVNCWNELIPSETNVSYSDYSSLYTTVDVTDSHSVYNTLKTLLCYPISPSLEAASCPCYSDASVPNKLLDSAIREVEMLKPDGLMIGESHVKLNSFGSDLQIYCFPEWGFDVKEHIKISLRQCLRDSADYEAVHIVPPGVFGLSKFPKTFLVQTVFETLDELLLKDKSRNRQRKVVLIVPDKSYCDEFKSERQKRYPNKEKKRNDSILKRIKDWWSKKDEVDTIEIMNTIPPTEMKIWGILQENIQQAYSCLKLDLENLMTKNEVCFNLNKTQMKCFEDIKNSLKNLPVKIIFTKKYVQKVKSCTNCSGKNKGKNKNPCQKCKNQEEMVVASSQLKIQGLSKQNVKDFQQMFTEKASASKQSTPIDDFSTEVDLLETKKSPANGSKEKLYENHPKTKGAECMEANEMSTSPLKEHSFFWMMETQGEEKDGSEASPQVTYTRIPEELQQEVEQAYIENKGSFIKEHFNFNFGEMFVSTKKEKEKKGLIRSEISNIKDRNGIPTNWTTKENEKPHYIELSKSDKEFTSIETELTDKILVKLKTLQAYRVENFELYQRFKNKTEKLDGKPVRLWHQVSKEKYTKLVCEYGFHQHFSGMPSGHNNLGKGVSFSNDPRKCFTNASFQSNHKYYLFHANVMLGKSGRGRKKFLGTPEQQSATNEEKDVFMVFSDAQAYPRHLIVFTVE